jgi:predicted protein tyrosine phosphatase
MKFDNPFPEDGFQGEDEATYSNLRLEVFGQYQCQQYEPGDDEVCISISSAGHGIVNPTLPAEFVDVLRLEFDDTAVGDFGMVNAKTISNEQADLLAQFVSKHFARKKLVIHCFAGMSRSRSAAGAIAEVLTLPYRYTIMNPSVYNTVRIALLKYFR